MATDFGMRGKAAGRLLKKGAPPEDDLGLPPEDGAPAAPPTDDAAGVQDLAALLGGGVPGEAPTEEGVPGDPGLPPEEGAPPEPDLEGALAGVEAALEGLPPEAAEEIRGHMNAIREIAASGGAPTPGPESGGMMNDPLAYKRTDEDGGGEGGPY